MMDPIMLHDLKRIAEVAKALMEACDNLYNDAENHSKGISHNGRVSIMDIQKGGLDARLKDEF